MTKDGIISKVRTIMNETGAEESLSLLSEDTVKLSEYIEAVIPDAINILSAMEEVPVNLLPQNTITSATENSEDGCSVVQLPEDFIRFIAARFENWKREVQVIYPYGGEAYKQQHNSVTRSGVNKPSCVFANNANGKTVECFPIGNIEYFSYVKSLDSDISSDLNDVSDTLYNAICYMCAYLVYNIFEMPATGKQMYDIALQNIPKA